MDFQKIFQPSLPLSEIVFRGTVIYLFLFVLFRIFRRQAGAIGVSDLLFVVIIADAIQNGLGRDYTSVTEAIVLALTIAAWDYLIDYLSYRSPFLERLFNPSPSRLIADGKIIQKNLDREMITREDLYGHLRQNGVEKISQVKSCCLESDGKISIIKF